MFLDFFMGIKISECFLDLFMGMTISECFLDFFYGDRNFWTFSFQVLMEIRNSEFSAESFSVMRD